MNDAWGYEENTQSEPGHNDGPKALREAYAAQKAANEAIMAELAAIRQERTAEKLSSVFSELGVPDAAKLYSGEPDPDKAKEWALSMKAAFGSGNVQGSDPASNADIQPQSPLGDAATQQQFQQMTEAGQNGVPLGNFQAAEAAVGTANDLSSLIAAMNAANQHNPGI
jgi:hypothetical protein